METQQKLLIGFIFVLVAGALFLTLSSPKTPAPQNNTKNDTVILTPEEKLLFDSLNFGSEISDYTYSYNQSSGTYQVQYNIMKKGDEGLVEIVSPISAKQIYLYQNDVAICVKLNSANFTCSSAFDKNLSQTNLQVVNQYVWNIRSLFFNSQTIQKDNENIKTLLAGKYLTFTSPITQVQVEGRFCQQLNYTIDYTSMSAEQTRTFGLGPSSPKIFNLSVCMDGNTLIQRTLSYDLNGTPYQNIFELNSLSTTTPQLPQYPLLASNVGGIVLLFEEKDYQSRFASCFAMSDSQDKEQCLLVLSKDLQNPELCNLTPNSKDFCLYRLAGPESIYLCDQIQGQKYHDGCYYSVSLSTRNQTLCANIRNITMADDCRATIKNNLGLNSSQILNKFDD